MTLNMYNNCFGDTLVDYKDNTYHLFKGNGNEAKDLLNLLLEEKEPVFLMGTINDFTDNSCHVPFYSAVKYLQEAVELNTSHDELMRNLEKNNSSFVNRPMTAGEEIAATYGY